jgi:Zn-dependent alcohol dehydrogenase
MTACPTPCARWSPWAMAISTIVLHPTGHAPIPRPGEVLIKVGACGLNNTDVNTRTGWYSKAVTEATTGERL